jgi:hypothetical protein
MMVVVVTVASLPVGLLAGGAAAVLVGSSCPAFPFPAAAGGMGIAAGGRGLCVLSSFDKPLDGLANGMEPKLEGAEVVLPSAGAGLLLMAGWATAMVSLLAGSVGASARFAGAGAFPAVKVACRGAAAARFSNSTVSWAVDHTNMTGLRMRV